MKINAKALEEIIYIFNMDYNPDDPEDVEWFERSLKAINKRIKNIKNC